MDRLWSEIISVQAQSRESLDNLSCAIVRQDPEISQMSTIVLRSSNRDALQVGRFAIRRDPGVVFLLGVYPYLNPTYWEL